MVVRRSRVPLALVALSILAAATGALASLSFSIHGDWGIPINWADTLAKRSQDRNSKFILAIGDNFYGKLTHGYHGVKSTTDSKWKTIFEDIYTHKFFDKPWYVIAGNHDHESSVRAQINYEGKSKRWNFPRRYYIVPKMVGNSKIDIFMIDTTPLSASAKKLKKAFGLKFDFKQLDWLKKKLQNSKAKWKIVVGHHPIVKAQKGGNNKLQKYVKPLLEKYKVAAYIAGHTHNMQHVQSSKLHWLTIGNGAIQVGVKNPVEMKGIKRHFIFPTAEQIATPRCAAGNCRGFAVITMKSATKMTVYYYDATGALLKSVNMGNPNK